MSTAIYDEMIQPKGAAYRASQIKAWSHYLVPVDDSESRLAGNSRIWGDASPEVQSKVIDILIEASRNAGLDVRNTAHVLAIARIESGFNPDAAAGTSSATGLGQFINKTGASYGIDDTNRFDATSQARALVAHYIDNRDLAARRGQGETYIYKYHHDGPSADSGGLELAQRKVLPLLDRYTRFVEAHVGLEHSAENRTSDNARPALSSLGRDANTVRIEEPDNAKILHNGDHGADVRALQVTLTALGFDDARGRALEADSAFGPRTGEAVRAFQRAHGLNVDGVVGADTRRALDAALRSVPEASSAVEPVARPTQTSSLDRLLAAARGDDPLAFRTALADFTDTPFGRRFQAASAELAVQPDPAMRSGGPEPGAAER